MNVIKQLFSARDRWLSAEQGAEREGRNVLERKSMAVTSSSTILARAYLNVFLLFHLTAHNSFPFAMWNSMNTNYIINFLHSHTAKKNDNDVKIITELTDNVMWWWWCWWKKKAFPLLFLLMDTRGCVHVDTRCVK
jgi:hypothetical protein